MATESEEIFDEANSEVVVIDDRQVVITDCHVKSFIFRQCGLEACRTIVCLCWYVLSIAKRCDCKRFVPRDRVSRFSAVYHKLTNCSLQLTPKIEHLSSFLCKLESSFVVTMPRPFV